MYDTARTVTVVLQSTVVVFMIKFWFKIILLYSRPEWSPSPGSKTGVVTVVCEVLESSNREARKRVIRYCGLFVYGVSDKS